MNRRTLFAGATVSALTLSTAHAQTPTDDEAANVETVRRFFTEFRGNRDIEALNTIVAEDYASQDPKAAPGIDAYKTRSEDYYRNIDYSYTEYTWTEYAIVADGNVVVWRGHEGGTTTDGKLTNVLYIYWFELNSDHLITTFWAGVDPSEAFLFP